MPLLVVPLGPEEAGGLTLAEWDRLLHCDLVLFERADHPLIARLEAAGVHAGPFDDEPDPDAQRSAFVADPESPRVLDLARRGAEVLGPGRTPDALTAAWGATIARRAAVSAAGLAAVMARLRGADGCPWDQKQSHESLKPHLIEEAYEVIDAIERGQTGAELEEELGDLLLQVVFHSQLAADDDRFDLARVADRIVAKLLHRHPHVFSDTVVAGADEVVANWEAIKSKEKERAGPFDDIPSALPALSTAYKTQKRAAALGWSADETEARERLARAVGDDLLGEALFWLVALARARGLDPEGTLRASVARFRKTVSGEPES